jgi:hypothetical protein
MDNGLASIVGNVDSLHVNIDNLNDPLVGFCFLRSIDSVRAIAWACRQANGVLSTINPNDEEADLEASLWHPWS